MDLFSDTYRTISEPTEGYFKDRGSKFISRAFPVKSEEEIKEILQNLRTEYHDAKHHCYSYILGPTKSAYRINEDGEPSGTAAKQIYGQLLSYDLTNILVVVIRYFGGTKLGIPGLINAYRTATKEALDKASIIEKTVDELITIKYDYPIMDIVMRFLKEKSIEIVETKFELNCQIIIKVRLSESQKVIENLKSIYGVEIEI
ncbi:MAG: YigZ family protein [Bacteroidetes bacterium CG2_30_33_31]|nr:MAG: YigZ family protein [Bacteroidetes bacterium CG2_30_33_31]